MAQIRRGVWHLLRPNVATIEAYPAPEPLAEFARSLGVDPGDVLKLDQNENPYGCSPRVREVLGSFAWYHVYPDPLHRALRDRLGHYVGVDPRQIVVGNGSDELIELILRMFVEPGDRVVSAGPTFGYYATACAAVGAEYQVVPRGERFEVDPDLLTATIDARTKVLFLASPN